MARVRELSFGKRDRRRFVDVEFRLNGHDPRWVPPLRIERMAYLDPNRNPFFEHAEVAHFVLTEGGRDIGRIAAIRNHRHEEIHGDAVGFFGFFECADDAAGVAALVDAAADWTRDRGLTSLRGPVSYDTNDASGLLVEGFDDPAAIMMPWNRPSLPPLLEETGLVKVKDLLAYELDHRTPIDRVRRISNRVRRREGISIRGIEMKDFEAEVGRVRDLYNAAWEKNWGFVPLTEAEIAHLAKNLKRVVEPELVLFAEVGGEPVGFAMTLPDANQALRSIRSGRLFPFGLLRMMRNWKKIDRARIITLGLLPDFRNRGLEALLYVETWDRGTRKGFTRGECSWVLEDNRAMTAGVEALGAQLTKRYRIYERPL